MRPQIQITIFFILLSVFFTIASIYFLWTESRLCFLFTAMIGVILTVNFFKILKNQLK